MKVILSKSFIRLAITNLDDEPGFANRFPSDSGVSPSLNRGTEGEEEILERWNKKRKPKRKTKRIYQLGLDVEESPLEEQERLRNYS